MEGATRLTLLSRSAAESRGKLHLDPNRGEAATVFMSGQQGRNYTCGRCGSVLLSKVPRLLFANAALRCNHCGRYNDGGRPAKYSTPTMNEDVDQLPRPKERYHRLEGGAPSPHDPLLEQLHSRFVEQWQAAQGDRPRRLYHYTTLQGLQGILNSHQMWVTDVAYLNDSLEMQLGFSIVEETLQRKEREGSEMCKLLLSRSRVSGSPTDPSTGYYVACFCEDRDLLSQWRAYASNGGGYAIGFSAYEMAYEGLVALRRVIYDYAQQKQLVTDTIDRICGAFERVAKNRTVADLDSDHTLPSFAQLLASHVREYLVAFKHDTFREEREWRIILPWSRDAHLHHVKFRANAGLATPYMALHPRTPSPETPLLPIVEVVHGPTLHPDLTKKSLHLLLQSTSYDHVEVDGSRAPLRA